MQNGKDDRGSPGLGRVQGKSDDCRWHHSVVTISHGITIFSYCCLLMLGATLLMVCGCGSRQEGTFTDRATENGRAARIETLKQKTRSGSADAGLWQQLGAELLRESGSLYRGDDVNLWRNTERTLDEAVAAFEHALRLDSTNAQLYAQAGHAHLSRFLLDPLFNDTDRLTTAISLLEQSVRLDPQAVDALIDLGIAWTPTWRSEGDSVKAMRYLEKAMSLKPDMGMAYWALSRSHEAGGQSREVLVALRKALDLGLSDEVAQLQLPRMYSRAFYRMMSEDWESEWSPANIVAFIARPLRFFSVPEPNHFRTGVFRRADALGLRNPGFYSELSWLYSTLGRKDLGFNFLVRSFELDSLEDYGGWWYYKEDQWLEKFLQTISPTSYYGLLRAAQLRSPGTTKDSSTIHNLIQNAIRLQPTFGAAYVMSAQDLYRHREEKKSKEVLEKALTLKFHSSSWMMKAAWELMMRKEYDLALRYYQRLLDLDLVPKIVAKKSIASVYERKGDLRTAYALYLEIDRAYPKIHLMSWWGRETALSISAAYEEHGELDKAISIVQRSLTTPRWRRAMSYGGTNEDVHPLVRLGELYSKTQDSTKAIASLLKALEIDDSYGETYYYLGIEYARQGLKEKAAENLGKAIELNVRGAKEKLEKLNVPDAGGKK